MRILIIEDDKAQAEQLRQPFEPHAKIAADLETAIELTKSVRPDIVILDAYFFAKPPTRTSVAGFMAGRYLNALDDIYEGHFSGRPDVILISGAENVENEAPVAGEWMQSGRISDVLPKGVRWQFFMAILEQKIELLYRKRQWLPVLTATEDAFAGLQAHGILTRDPQMIAVWNMLTAAANAGYNTFIVGETGTGKELVANAIARLRRNRKPLTINCNTMIESTAGPQMFGTKGKMFTEVGNTEGWLSAAGDGVLFFDQFCSIPVSVQYGLLRVLESDTRDFSPVGSTETKHALCMFVFADILHPAAARDQHAGGKFVLQEMAYRVATLVVSLPPLRQRCSDIRLLTDAFAHAINRELGKAVTFTEDVYETLSQGRWPGNVRALRDLMKSIIAAAGDRRLSFGDVVDLLGRDQRCWLESELGLTFGKSSQVTGGTTVSPVSNPDMLAVLRSEMLDAEPSTWLKLAAKRRPANTDEKLHAAWAEDDKLIALLDRALEEADADWIAEVARALDPNAADEQPCRVVQRWIGGIKGALRAREGDDPAAHVHYLALLYLVLEADHRADRDTLRRVLGRGYAQIVSLEESLLEHGSEIACAGRESGDRGRCFIEIRPADRECAAAMR